MGAGSQAEKAANDGAKHVCSVCLEHVGDSSKRSMATLICGHQFHLDCIGSAFNAKGTMECPNCRRVEDGEWLFSSGAAAQFEEYDFTHDYNDDADMEEEFLEMAETQAEDEFLVGSAGSGLHHLHELNVWCELCDEERQQASYHLHCPHAQHCPHMQQQPPPFHHPGPFADRPGPSGDPQADIYAEAVTDFFQGGGHGYFHGRPPPLASGGEPLSPPSQPGPLSTPPGCPPSLFNPLTFTIDDTPPPRFGHMPPTPPGGFFMRGSEREHMPPPWQDAREWASSATPPGAPFLQPHILDTHIAAMALEERRHRSRGSSSNRRRLPALRALAELSVDESRTHCSDEEQTLVHAAREPCSSGGHEGSSRQRQGNSRGGTPAQGGSFQRGSSAMRVREAPQLRCMYCVDGQNSNSHRRRDFVNYSALRQHVRDVHHIELRSSARIGQSAL